MPAIAVLVVELSDELKKRNWKVSVAESCTGGGLSFRMTNLPGSSEWFDCGFVAYSNPSKINLLNVQPASLDKFGAVSAEVALEMANGAIKNSQAQISVSITGIAGPDGGTEGKPIGTVWFGIATPNNTFTQMQHFTGSRQDIREKSIQTALELLLQSI